MIHVIASIEAQAGQREALADAFRKILDRVRAKPGCLEYSLARHTPSGLPGQAPYDDRVLTIVEKWSDLDALKAHISDPEYVDWFSSQWNMIATGSMQILESI